MLTLILFFILLLFSCLIRTLIKPKLNIIDYMFIIFLSGFITWGLEIIINHHY